MTLFFYGAVTLKHDAAETSAILLQCAQDVYWNLSLNTLQAAFSFKDLFGFIDNHEWLIFELIGAQSQAQNVEPLYAGYGGETMVAHYRAVAKQFGVDHAEALEFGASPVVDEAYRNQPADLPVICFIRSVLTAFPDRGFVVNLDQDFENRFGCDEVVGDKTRILKEVWLTVAFGFTWPHLRLKTPVTDP